MASAEAGDIPTERAEIMRAADALGMPIPAACLPGIEANLALLRSHAEVMLGHKRSASS